MIHNRISFVNARHQFGTRLDIDEDFEMVDTPIGFQNIELYPHQATVVSALLAAENRRYLQVNTSMYNNITNAEIVLETSALVLSEPFGSGKTIEILALISHRPIPRALPTHINSALCWSKKYSTGVFRHEIARRFIGKKTLIRSNLIVVGSSVLVQWENAIKEFTNLKCFTISDYYKLQKFYQLYMNKTINAYDIILLKNGKVTGNFIIPGEKMNKVKDYRGLISVVSKITADACWSRVIYDDFDTISIPADSNAINALFTIYVSATKAETHHKQKPIHYPNILEAIKDRALPLNAVCKDDILFSNFNIRNVESFVEASTKIPLINGFRYVYNNPDDNYIRLIGAMGEVDALRIMEMLNGDAISTAADILGIKTKSTADIFQRMLDKKYEKFLHDQYVLDKIGLFKQNIKNLPIHPDGKKHTPAELDSYRADLIKNRLPSPKYYSILLDTMSDELSLEYQLAKEQDGLAISRVIDNIKEGECQICKLPLEEFDTFIVRCCGLIVCDICGIKGNRISKRYDPEINCETLYGFCANCKTTIYPQTDLIFVDKSFDLESILKAKGDEKEIEPLPEFDPKPAEPEIKNPKLRALCAIIRGEIPEKREIINIKIKHLLIGKIDIPQDNQKRKVLVFANFNETLNLVENFLVEQNIEFLRLGGTFQEKADTIKKFQIYGQVLLINSQQHCAGLNIQFCTDIVFFHKITDENIEAQVAGRGQRIGRTCNLRIHYLAYQNEKNLI